jgi:pantoate--beta-alanine ligase
LKLFQILRPALAFFGEKDYQQLALVRRLVRDLNVPLQVVGVPTVRESDGLAMSSRNRRLNLRERAFAPCLFKALLAGSGRIARGERNVVAIKEPAGQVLHVFPAIKMNISIGGSRNHSTHRCRRGTGASCAGGMDWRDTTHR